MHWFLIWRVLWLFFISLYSISCTNSIFNSKSHSNHRRHLIYLDLRAEIGKRLFRINESLVYHAVSCITDTTQNKARLLSFLKKTMQNEARFFFVSARNDWKRDTCFLENKPIIVSFKGWWGWGVGRKGKKTTLYKLRFESVKREPRNDQSCFHYLCLWVGAANYIFINDLK